jgi:hypothetical protein
MQGQVMVDFLALRQEIESLLTPVAAGSLD